MMEQVVTPKSSSPPTTASSDSGGSTDHKRSESVAGASSRSDTASSTPDRIRRRLSHNPSPPPELLAAGAAATGDAIGDTLYSERWVLRALMKLSEMVEDKSLGIATDDDADDFVEELNSDVETILCQLWDMSANNDVVHFLLGLPTLDLIADALTRTKIPRLTEIVAGIIANMACIEEACQKVTEHKNLKTVTLQLLDVSDPPTLTELFRFLLTCTQNETHSETWLKLYREDNHFLPHLTFIMASSTNIQLLKMAGEFVDFVLDAVDDFCSDWASMEFVDSLIEAMRQVGVQNKDIVETYLHILQLLSTSDKGKNGLLHHADSVVKVASRYIAYLCDDECIDIMGRESGLASAVLLMHVLLIASPASIIDLLKQDKSLRFVTKLTKAFIRSPSTNDTSVKMDSSLLLRKLLEEALVTLIEEVLAGDKGTELLFDELSNQEENNTEAFLVWAKTFPGSRQLYRRLVDAVRVGAHNSNRLVNAFEKVVSLEFGSRTDSEGAKDEG